MTDAQSMSTKPSIPESASSNGGFGRSRVAVVAHFVGKKAVERMPLVMLIKFRNDDKQIDMLRVEKGCRV